MRLDEARLPTVLADAWQRWAHRCTELSADQWAAATRCPPWDVHALTLHLCPDRAMFDALDDATIEGPAAVTDAAELLRQFNRPDGVAHTTADQLAQQAVSDAERLPPEVIVSRFTECAGFVRGFAMPSDTVIQYPVVGSTTLAVVGEVAVMEATVHLLDLADAVGGVEPSAEALYATRDLLIAVPDPTAAIEVLADRAPPAVAVPAIR